MAIRYEPENAEYYLLSGMICAHLADFKGTQDALDKCLEYNPALKLDAVEIYFNLLDRLESTNGEYIILTLNQIIFLAPDIDLGHYHYHLGFYYFDKLDNDKTIFHLTHALSACPENSLVDHSLFTIARAYRNIKNYEMSYHYFLLTKPDQFSSLEKTDFYFQFGETCYHYANQLIENHQDEAALPVISQLLYIHQPTTLIDDCYFLLGEIYSRLDRTDLATQSYQRVIDLDPFQRDRLVFLAKDRIKSLRSGKPDGKNSIDSLEY